MFEFETEKQQLVRDLKYLFFDTSIKQFQVGVRTWNMLEYAGIHTIYDLIRTSESELLKIPGLGRVTLNDIKAEMDRHGLKFGMPMPPRSSHCFDTTAFEKIDALANIDARENDVKDI